MNRISATGQGLFHAYTGERRCDRTDENILLCNSGESSQFFVSKSANDSSSGTGTFSVGISGPSTVFLDANETEHGYEVIVFICQRISSVFFEF